MPQSLKLSLPNLQATETLGGVLARQLAPGKVIFLYGDLGAGKTTLARAMLRAAGVEGRVKSPSYTLVELYAVSSLNFYHFDFYRFNDPSEWQASGFRELFGGPGVCLVEWPEKAAGFLPAADLDIALVAAPNPDQDEDAREATLSAGSDWGRTCLAVLARSFQVAGDSPAQPSS